MNVNQFNLYIMKRYLRMKLLYYTLLFVILASCKDEKGQQDIGIWHFDVTKEYPTKEIYIQDIADVDYIPLETNDSILWRGREVLYLDDDYIVGANRNNGVYFHDGKGKALNMFNKMGQGPKEYLDMYKVQYDKKSDEIYINDMFKYYVYDKEGNFKRSFQGIEDKLYSRIEQFFILNENELIQYNYNNHYTRVSRLTGEHLGDIKLGVADSTTTLHFRKNNMIFNTIVSHFTKDKEGYIITSFSSDTTYLLTSNLQLKPIGVRIPPVSSQDVPVFLLPVKNTPRYYFMSTIKKEDSFPVKAYMMDKKTNQIYYLKDYFKNKDYIGLKVHLDMFGPSVLADLPNNVCVQSLNITKLCEAYEEGKLSGKLKDIAANLKEDDNPVLMIIKFRE